MKCIRFSVVPFLLVLFLASCGMSKEQVTSKVKEMIIADRTGTFFLLKNLVLVKKTDNQYEGVVTFIGSGDLETKTIIVTADGDAVIYRFEQ